MYFCQLACVREKELKKRAKNTLLIFPFFYPRNFVSHASESMFVSIVVGMQFKLSCNLLAVVYLLRYSTTTVTDIEKAYGRKQGGKKWKENAVVRKRRKNALVFFSSL